MKQMWQKFILLVIIAFLAFALLACTGNRASAVQSSDVNRQILDLPAEFEVSPISVHRSGCTVGEPVMVKATIENVGDKAGEYTAILTLDGREISRKNVPVEPKRSEEISFLVIPGMAGVKNVTIGNSSATLAAYRWPYTIIYDSDTRLGGPGHERGPQSYGTGPAMTPPISIRGDYGHMVRFSPPAVPFKIQMLLINGEASVRSKTDWDNTMQVRIWDNTNKLLWSVALPWRFFRYPRQWNHIDVPNIMVNNDFYVEIMTNSGVNDTGAMSIDYYVDPAEKGIYLYWDKPQSYLAAPTEIIETHSSVSYMGASVEVPSKYKGLNWYIRATGDGSLPNN